MGLRNCAWHHDGLIQAIANQSDSPHAFDLSPTGDHVETNMNHAVHN